MMKFDQLEQILDVERDILTTGQLEKLSDVFTQKESLLRDLADDLAALPHGLGKKIERNQSLLKASAEGIRQARNRIKEFRHVRDCLSFYGAEGRKKDHSLEGARRLSKRT